MSNPNFGKRLKKRHEFATFEVDVRWGWLRALGFGPKYASRTFQLTYIATHEYRCRIEQDEEGKVTCTMEPTNPEAKILSRSFVRLPYTV